eukprot:TRINITY_DN14785_c0_g1_i1.p1 TRINITY_DN14785_c0_g1~~TRINITY_DN14785_c0_g1_i1.p1  ORF type:complete len:254 (+),score=70.03 TRINITY_DN14785_c0_g1_i1:100-762(+)
MEPGCAYTVSPFLSAASSASFTLLMKRPRVGAEEEDTHEEEDEGRGGGAAVKEGVEGSPPDLVFRPVSEWVHADNADGSWGAEEEQDVVVETEGAAGTQGGGGCGVPHQFVVSVQRDAPAYLSLAAFNMGNLVVRATPVNSSCEGGATESLVSSEGGMSSGVFDELNQVALCLPPQPAAAGGARVEYYVTCETDLQSDIEGSFELSVLSSATCALKGVAP